MTIALAGHAREIVATIIPSVDFPDRDRKPDGLAAADV
jgi:hypothetical protein